MAVVWTESAVEAQDAEDDEREEREKGGSNDEPDEEEETINHDEVERCVNELLNNTIWANSPI